MATAASEPYRITVEQFLAIEWDDSDTKAELDNGVIRIIRMMAGGTADHSRVQGNIFASLFEKLRGTGCRPHGPDMAVLVGEYSVRYPDISVFCGRNRPDDGKRKAFDDPRLVVEILSPGTRDHDFDIKLPEYREIASLEAILYVDPDPDAETIQLFTRTAGGEWRDVGIEMDEDVVLTALEITLMRGEIFAQ
jgi:Uma2 family endonuclease